MQQKRSSFGAAAFNGCIYVGGGIVGCNELSSVEVFDPKIGTWRFDEASLPTRRWAFGMLAI